MSPGRISLWLLLRVALFTLVVPGTVAVYIPLWVLNEYGQSAPLPIGALRYLGILLIIAGIGVYCWCAWDFASVGRGTPAPVDHPKSLVAVGLYRYVRNPMYLGVLAILFGEAVFFRSKELLVYACLVFVLFFLFVLLYEEPALHRQFGKSYDKYRHSVPRWIPRRPRPNRKIRE